MLHFGFNVGICNFNNIILQRETMPNLSSTISKGFKYQKAEQQCVNIKKNLHKR